MSCNVRPTRAQAGMTLIEMLVVLTIIGITASLAVLSLNTGGPARGQAEAKRLEARLQLAADETMLSDRSLAIDLSQNGYSFVQWDDAKASWQPSEVAMLGERYRLPGGLTLASADGRSIIPLGSDGAMRDITLILGAGQRHWTIGFDGLTVSGKASAAAVSPAT